MFATFPVPDTLGAAGIRVESRAVVQVRDDGAVELADGDVVPRDVLFVHPRQRQIDLVRALGLATDDAGFVRVDEQRETSVPGIYAAGDLTTPMQSAITAAASAMQTAASLMHGLVHELVATPRA